jgi:hypothetical protein
MSPVLLTSAAVLSDERDPIWEAMLASPIVEDDLTDEQRAALEEGLEDIRAGRVVSRDLHTDRALEDSAAFRRMSLQTQPSP